MVAEAQLAFTLEDQEQLLLAVVAVERALHLAGRQDGQIEGELPGADLALNSARFEV